MRRHVAHLKQLERKGQLVLCGPFQDHKGGMVIVSVGSLDEAKAIAESDPFVGDEPCWPAGVKGNGSRHGYKNSPFFSSLLS